RSDPAARPRSETVAAGRLIRVRSGSRARAPRPPCAARAALHARDVAPRVRDDFRSPPMFSIRPSDAHAVRAASLAGCTCDDDFRALLEPHLAALHAIARGILASDDLACDVVQEASLALWTCAAHPADVRG